MLQVMGNMKYWDDNDTAGAWETGKIGCDFYCVTIYLDYIVTGASLASHLGDCCPSAYTSKVLYVKKRQVWMSWSETDWLTPPGNNTRFLHRKKSQHSHFNIHMLTRDFSFKHRWTDHRHFTEAKDLPLLTFFFADFRKFQRFHCLSMCSKSRDVSWLSSSVFTYICWLSNCSLLYV